MYVMCTPPNVFASCSAPRVGLVNSVAWKAFLFLLKVYNIYKDMITAGK